MQGNIRLRELWVDLKALEFVLLGSEKAEISRRIEVIKQFRVVMREKLSQEGL